jgi:hypothetical protein
MALTEYHDLIEDMKKLLKKIQSDPPDADPFVVCLPGTYRAYFNIH